MRVKARSSVPVLPAPSGRVGVALFATVALLGGLPAPAAAVTVTGTKVGPSTVTAATKQVIYYLDFTAGAADERFSVALTPPQFATKGTRDEGEAVDGPLQYAFVGPGTVGQSIAEPSTLALCSDREKAFHGYAAGKTTVDLAIPAKASTTLAIRYNVGRRAPWVDSDYRLRFALQPSLIGEYSSGSPLFGGPAGAVGDPAITQTDSVPVAAKGKAKIGAHLLLSASPKPGYGEGEAATAIKRSTGVKVSGQLLPKLAGKRVIVQWRKAGGPLRTAASMKTRAFGRFSTTVKPPGKGTYELWATYPNQTGPLTSDSTSCPLRYAVN
ncbi:MAG: hypothetical protein Q7T55_13095 [Solirubrobacteraceae bacterium]|nr:hypothetical protein [Solirubrobacteraceae bacterium]